MVLAASLFRTKTRDCPRPPIDDYSGQAGYQGIRAEDNQAGILMWAFPPYVPAPTETTLHLKGNPRPMRENSSPKKFWRW